MQFGYPNGAAAGSVATAAAASSSSYLALISGNGSSSSAQQQRGVPLGRHLEAIKMSLPGEIRALNVRLTTPLIVRQNCEAQIKASNAKLHHLGATVQGS